MANNLYLFTLSLILPINGIIRSELTPDTINKKGNCSLLIPRLFTANTVPYGIIIKPPTDNTAVVKKPIRYGFFFSVRSEEHTSELKSRENLVCRLLLE